MAEHNLVGKRGEELAVEFLREKGYNILEKNWRFQKAEIDLIVEYENQLIIVEVKTRSSNSFEHPKEAVTLAKQKRIILAADAYIQKNNIDLECRFDIVSIVMNNNREDIEHLEAAFSAFD